MLFCLKYVFTYFSFCLKSFFSLQFQIFELFRCIRGNISEAGVAICFWSVSFVQSKGISEWRIVDVSDKRLNSIIEYRIK